MSVKSVRYSASQLGQFSRCERKWWLQAIKKMRPPVPPWMERGRADHKEAELYLLQGTQPKSPRVQALLPYLPTPPWPKGLVEGHFQIGDMVGYIDYIDWAEASEARSDRPRINDLKFRANWDLGKVPVTDLKRDAQALIYTLAVTGSQTASVFRWLVVHTKQLKVRPLSIEYEAGEALSLFREHWEPVLSRMPGVAATRDPCRVRATGYPDECQAYRGCYFAPHCATWGTPVYGPISVLFSPQRTT